MMNEIYALTLTCQLTVALSLVHANSGQKNQSEQTQYIHLFDHIESVVLVSSDQHPVVDQSVGYF